MASVFDAVTRVVVIAETYACQSCTLIIANGEDTSQEDSGEAHGMRMTTHYGAGVMALVVTCHGENLTCEDFSTRPCGVCGDDLAGERHAVAELGRRSIARAPEGRPLGRLE